VTDAVWSRETNSLGKTFYFNAQTGDTRWLPPSPTPTPTPTPKPMPAPSPAPAPRQTPPAPSPADERLAGTGTGRPEPPSQLLRCFSCLPEIFGENNVPRVARSKSCPTAVELREAAAAESSLEITNCGDEAATGPTATSIFQFGAVGASASSGCASPRRAEGRPKRKTTAVGTATAAAATTAAATTAAATTAAATTAAATAAAATAAAATAATAATAANANAQDDRGGRCVVCLEDVSPTDAQVVCDGPGRHRVCATCLPRLVRDRAARSAPDGLTPREQWAGAIDVACPLADVPVPGGAVSGGAVSGGGCGCDCARAFSPCVLAAALARAPPHADGEGAFAALLSAQQAWAEARAGAAATAELRDAAVRGGGGGKRPLRVRRSRSLTLSTAATASAATATDTDTDTDDGADGSSAPTPSLTDRWSAQLQASRARRAASKARRRQEKHADLVAVRAGVGSCSSYMCRRCGFGPTQHDRCDDLVAHHGDRLDRHGRRRISNACQNCGWFSYNIRHWPRWDGRRLGCRARYRPLRHVRWLHTAALYVPNRIARKIFD